MKRYLFLVVGLAIGYLCYPLFHSKNQEREIDSVSKPIDKTEGKHKPSKRIEIVIRNEDTELLQTNDEIRAPRVIAEHSPQAAQFTSRSLVAEQEAATNYRIQINDATLATIESHWEDLKNSGYTIKTREGWSLHLSDHDDNVLSRVGFEDNDLIRNELLWSDSGSAADQNVRNRFLAILRFLENTR